MGSYAVRLSDEDLCCPICKNPLSGPANIPKPKTKYTKQSRGKSCAPHLQRNMQAYRNTRIAVGKCKDSDEVALAKCGHLFHKFCLRHHCYLFREFRPNQANRVTCPLCQEFISMNAYSIDYKAHQGQPFPISKEYKITYTIHSELLGQKDFQKKKLSQVKESIDNAYHVLEHYRHVRKRLQHGLKKAKQSRRENENLYYEIEQCDRMLEYMKKQHLKIVRKFIAAAKEKSPEDFIHMPKRLAPVLHIIEEDDRLAWDLGEIISPFELNNTKSDRRGLLREIMKVVAEKLATERRKAEISETKKENASERIPNPRKNKKATQKNKIPPVVVKVQNSSVSILSATSLTKESIQKIMATVETPIKVIKKACKSSRKRNNNQVRLADKVSNNMVDKVSASDIKIIYMPKRKMVEQLSEPCRTVDESDSFFVNVPMRKCKSTDAVLEKTRKTKSKALPGKAKSKGKLKLVNKRSQSITAISTTKEKITREISAPNPPVTFNPHSNHINARGDSKIGHGQNNSAVVTQVKDTINDSCDLTNTDMNNNNTVVCNVQTNDVIVTKQSLFDEDGIECKENPPTGAKSVLRMLYESLEESKANLSLMKANFGNKSGRTSRRRDENNNVVAEYNMAATTDTDSNWPRPTFFRVDNKGMIRPESPNSISFRHPTFLMPTSPECSSRPRSNEFFTGFQQPDEENQLDALSPEERYLDQAEQQESARNGCGLGGGGGRRPMFHGIPACLGMPNGQCSFQTPPDPMNTPVYLRKWQEQLPSRKILKATPRRATHCALRLPKLGDNAFCKRGLKSNTSSKSNSPRLIHSRFVEKPSDSIHLPPLTMYPAKRPSTAECRKLEKQHPEGPDLLNRFYYNKSCF